MPDESSSDETIEVEIEPAFKVMSFVFSIITLGVYYVLVWRSAVPRYPAVIDDKGMTLRSGMQIAWSEVTKTKSKPYDVLWVYVGKERAVIAPGAIKRGQEVLAIAKANTGNLP